MREKVESSESHSKRGSRPLRWLFFFTTAALLMLVLRLIRDRREHSYRYSGEQATNFTAEIPVERRAPATQAAISSFPPAIRPGEPEVTAAEAVDLPAQPSEPQDKGQDDLKRIEGIGPVYEQVLKDAGIATFHQLAETPVDRLRELFADRRLADPTSWPDQAALAARGDWEGLEELRGRLRGGRR